MEPSKGSGYFNQCLPGALFAAARPVRATGPRSNVIGEHFKRGRSAISVQQCFYFLGCSSSRYPKLVVFDEVSATTIIYEVDLAN